MENIEQAALAEFLDKGFQGASLRQIVKNAGVTTGAFYGYFSSKDALFASIVEPHAAALMGRFMEAQLSFAELPETEQPAHVGKESGAYLTWMVDYICQHREPVKLLLCGAEGTSYENFVHNMVEVEVEATLEYIEVLRRAGQEVPPLDRSLCSTAFLRWWSTICRTTRRCGMCSSCGRFTPADGSVCLSFRLVEHSRECGIVFPVVLT